MNELLRGKKLLILGAYKTEIEIINKARELGIYTIVTDSHDDWSLAPAKYEADEAWNISWSDIETLKNKCFENSVDGCFAGFSENRIVCAQKLSEAINKPFYADGANLEVICDKNKFKQSCIQAEIRTAETFQRGEEVKYPVIIKPADNGGSRGITICYEEKEFEEAYQKAISNSNSGTAIIEEYLTGDEIMVYYTVHDGAVSLSAMCDRHMHSFDKNITQLPIGYHFPSRHLEIFKKYNHEKFVSLIHKLGIQNGLIAFQAFVVGNDIVPFDPTYRLDGTMAYHMTECVNNTNVLEMLIRYSLTGSMGESAVIVEREKPEFNKMCFELPVLLGKGTISRINGLELVGQHKNVLHVFSKPKVGDTMNAVADFSQILCRIHMCVNDNAELQEAIRYIYDVLQVKDENGQDMIIGKDAVMRLIMED